jgi:phosphohistidine swiveling domain-containing protein
VERRPWGVSMVLSCHHDYGPVSMRETDEVGRGQKTYDFGTVRGRWLRLEGPDDVLALMDAEGSDAGAQGVIAVVRDAGATFLGPIFADLAGVVCTGGTIRSHIGIISREYRIPGLIAMEFTAPDASEPSAGTLVEMDASGGDGVLRLLTP